MIFVSKEGDIINTDAGDDYSKSVFFLIDEWNDASNKIEIQTSGSTGVPKLNSFLKRQIKASIDLTASTFGIDENSLLVCNLNINYVAGKMMVFRAQHLKADLMVFKPSSNPLMGLEKQIHLFSRYKKRIFLAFAPLQIQQIIQAKTNLEILRWAKVIIIGGAPISDALEAELLALNLPIFETYGMTETLSHVAMRKLGSLKNVFKPLADVHIDVNDQGCLRIICANTDFKWIQTNDLVKIYKNGSFKLMGRIDNTINSGGIKLQLEVLDKKIEKSNIIKSRYFIFGIPDESLGQKLVLIVENDEMAYQKSDFKQILTKFELPKEIFYIKKFVETPSGKIDKLKTLDAIIRN